MNFDAQQKLERAIQLHQAGQLTDAERLYVQILGREPSNFTAGHFLGVIRYQQGRIADAISLIGAALRLNPVSTGALTNYGLALKADGRLPEALASFDRAICSKPNDPELHNMRGLVLQTMRRFSEALMAFDRAIDLKPDYADGLSNRGSVLSEMRRFDEALAAFASAIAIRPRFAEALNNQGNALLALGRDDEALASYDLAISAKPDYAEAIYNRSQALLDAMRLEDALASYDRSIALKPDFAMALNGRGIALQRLGRLSEALASYDAALMIAADQNILNNRFSALILAKRFQEVRDGLSGTLDFAPLDDQAFGGLATAALHLCDWQLTTRLAPQVRSRTEEGRPSVDPLTLMGYYDDIALQGRAAENYQRDRVQRPARSLPGRTERTNSRIRIAYLSADFRTHPTSSLIAGLIERHDRERFEVSAISFSPDDQSTMRARLEAAFEHFHDVRDMGDREVAELLAKTNTDIAIDLNGHTQHARLGILAFRAAPIQVSYLGFPGTSGTSFIDYLIADMVVLPPAQHGFFTEKIAYLPHSYQANDSAREIGLTPKRCDVGLQDDAFVFCCFNNSWKITEPVFAIWMRLLSAVPGSLLWLIADNEGAVINLRLAAAKYGVDPDRIIFAPRVSEAEHLARHRLADLFLDTLPYNAHTTASDALWSGLPVLTCLGASFPSRVGASLLRAVGLPELVTRSPAEYEAVALKLAKDPSSLGALRDKLVRNAASFPLFDTDRFRRDMESAYTTMFEIAKRGEAPRTFAVKLE